MPARSERTEASPASGPRVPASASTLDFDVRNDERPLYAFTNASTSPRMPSTSAPTESVLASAVTDESVSVTPSSASETVFESR